tara:strand:- start:131 stop:238 length:108 start_codon:yes stop_codon:yes gene_type:complete
MAVQPYGVIGGISHTRLKGEELENDYRREKRIRKT